MSQSLTNVQQTEFDSLVKIQYRSKGFRLRDTVRMKNEIIGNTCQFRKVGQVIANQVAYQNTIAMQDPGFTAHTATLFKYAAGTGVDEIQDLTVNFETKNELAMLVAEAIGRRSDQIIINSFVGNALNTVATNASNFTYAKLREMVQYFEEDAVPIEERYVMMSGNNLRAMLASDQIISRFYTSNDAVSTGTLNYRELMGCNIRIIPSMTEGGIPLTGTVRNCFAWHKNSTGMAIGQDLRTEVNYLPRETTWFVNGIFFAGAVVVDNRGLIQINCDEAINP